MNHSPRWKIIVAPLIGLMATVAALFLLAIPNIRAATLTVNEAADSGPGALRGYEQITVTTSPVSVQPAVTWNNQAARDNPEACTIAIATGSATADGRPVLWKNRDYFGRTDVWQASLFRHEYTNRHFSNNVDDDRYGDRFAYVALSDRGDESQDGIKKETGFDPRAGANEEGLGLVSAQAHTLEDNGSQDDDAADYGINNGGLNHWILSRCKSITEVEKLLTDTNDGGGYNGSTARDTASLIAVIDRFGGAAIFEVDGNSFARQNITHTFEITALRPHSSGPPAEGYNGFDYRSNFSRISFTNTNFTNTNISFPYFPDEWTNIITNTITGSKVITSPPKIPDGINDLEYSASSFKRWERVAARMEDSLENDQYSIDYQYFIQKWMRAYAHQREYYLETLARSDGYAPYLTSRVNGVVTKTYN